MWNQYCYYFDLPKIRAGEARTAENEVASPLDPPVQISTIIWVEMNSPTVVFVTKFFRIQNI